MEAAAFVTPYPGFLKQVTAYDLRTRRGISETVPVRTVAFVPDPLPPKLDRERFIGQVSEELLAAQAGIAQLEGTIHALPNPDLLIQPFRLREATLSSRIENTIASVEEVAAHQAGRPPPRAEVVEVGNYLRALEHGLTSPLPLANRLVREMHAILMKDVRGDDKRPGQFRNGLVCIGDHERGFAQARFVPPPPGEDLHGCLDHFEQYLNADAVTHRGIVRYPRIIEIAFAHYQFEAIHPFNDGNGRLGRLLIAISLCRYGLLSRPVLYTSAFLERRREQYYDHLLAVSTHGRWEAWVKFFCQAVATQASDAIKRAERLRRLREEYVAKVSTKRASALSQRLVDYLFRSPALRVSTVAKELDITQPAAQKHVDALVNHGILIEVTGGRYNRLYVARGITQAVEDDAVDDDAFSNADNG